MMFRHARLAVLTAAAFAVASCVMLSPRTSAEILPYASINAMSMTGDLIVVGSYEGDGKLNVEQVLWPEETEIKPGAVLNIPALAQHSRKAIELHDLKEPVPEIETKKMVLFAKDDKGGMPVPFHHIGAGSMGVIWFDDKRCYGYTQIFDGNYTLTASGEGVEDVPKDKLALFNEIETGFKERHLWEDIKAIREPGRRALAMASFYARATRPEGTFHGAHLIVELKKIGLPAIPAIADTVEQLEPDEELWELASVLQSIVFPQPEKERARHLQPVVAPIIKWLEANKKSHPYGALEIVHLAADPKAIKVTRPYLEHESRDVVGIAASALAAMKDVESFERIAELLEKSEDVGLSTTELAFGTALFELDPKRARPLILKATERVGNGALSGSIPGLTTP